MPQRYSLVAETIRVLKEQIQAGAYTKALPSERTLCARLQVGRNTVRAALRKLEDEKWIHPSERGAPRRIRRWPHRTQRRSERPSQVCVLAGRHLAEFDARSLFFVDLLREHLADVGCRLDVLSIRQDRGGGALRRLDAMANKASHAAWVLLSCSENVQHWFADRGIPTVVLGYVAENVALPYVTSDLAAAAQHLAGRLLVQGHRRAALMQSGEGLFAHRLVAKSMTELKAPGGLERLRVVPVHHDGTVPGIRVQIERLLERKADRPTALVAITTPELTTTLTHLLHRGIQIPEEMSLVSLLDDHNVPHLVPEITRYTVSMEVLVKRLFIKLQAVWRQGNPAVRPSCVMCEFVKGKTLGPAPEQSSRTS